MRRELFHCRGLLLMASLALLMPAAANRARAADQFTRLTPTPAPKVIDSAEPYPGGNYGPERLVDGSIATENSSNGKGIGSFVVFDFGRALPLAGFEHVDRRDPATVGQSKLVLADEPSFAKPLGEVAVKHVGTSGGTTFFAFPKTIAARYVRWQVTALGPQNYSTVGGAEIRFFTAEPPQAAPVQDQLTLTGVPAVTLDGGKPVRNVLVRIEHPYAEPADAVLTVAGLPPRPLKLAFGTQSLEVALPSEAGEKTYAGSLAIGGKTIVEKQLKLAPVRPWTIHLLCHSHVDIGFTNVQTEVEKLHWKFIDQALDIIRATAGYPEGARFQWNSEVLWAVDSYLKQASPDRRKELIAAVRAGTFDLNGMYGNELTGLCRPDELFRLFDRGRRLSKELGVPIQSAMISDVPGYTWGIVPAMSQSGIRYFCVGTNHVHRIGNTIAAWGDKPFYWVSPSGQEKVLCWVAGKGYSWFHIHGRFEKVRPDSFFEYLQQLEADGFPYDILPLRYSIDGDNGPPDPKLPDLVKAWNEKYVWPKMRISTTTATFREFERRWGDKLPQARGDFTPYWEDGAGSSARETAAVRRASEDLVQAEALRAITGNSGGAYPAAELETAWRNVLLYNEHTWGAHTSIGQPDSEFTRAQWRIKGAFATDAAAQARTLLEKAVPHRRALGEKLVVDVYNTLSWPRGGLVTVLGPGTAPGAAVVRDSHGNALPSQRLSDGSLVALVADVPPLGAKRLVIEPGQPPAGGTAQVDGNQLVAGKLRVTIDAKTGGIASVASDGISVTASPGAGMNEYRYVAGRNPSKPQASGPATLAVKEKGPLVASLVCQSTAPGCRKLVREYRVVAGLDELRVVDLLDREQVRTPEGVHLGFSPNVPEGQMRVDVPWTVIRPEADQLAGACKNYFSVGRWIDVSNDRLGLTCFTLDCPLAEVGAIRMDVPSPFDARVWATKLEPTQTFFWYLMNNYWETNYKADQEGPTSFEFVLWPHGPFDRLGAQRRGLEHSRPLAVVPSSADAPLPRSLFQLTPPEVLATSVKPADDGRGVVVRLWNASDRPTKARIAWTQKPARVTLSGPFEDDRGDADSDVIVAPQGIVTLRTW